MHFEKRIGAASRHHEPYRPMCSHCCFPTPEGLKKHAHSTKMVEVALAIATGIGLPYRATHKEDQRFPCPCRQDVKTHGHGQKKRRLSAVCRRKHVTYPTRKQTSVCNCAHSPTTIQRNGSTRRSVLHDHRCVVTGFQHWEGFAEGFANNQQHHLVS